MASESETEGLPRFAIYKRDLNKLLRNHAHDEPARSQLKQLLLDLQLAVHTGLPLRARAKKRERQERLEQLRELEKARWTIARHPGHPERTYILVSIATVGGFVEGADRAQTTL